jgi:imidazolonepropionase-like amidohydrolase
MKILILGGKIIDGAGNYLDKGFVAIEGDQIVQIGKEPNPSSFPGWQRIDISGKTLVPGFIDCHVHLLLDASPDPVSLAWHESHPLLALKGAVDARKTLEAGITTIRDMGGFDHTELVLRDAIRRSLIPDPRMFGIGKVIWMTGGHSWPMGIEADGVDEVRKAVRREIKAGVDAVKFMATGGVMTPGMEPGSPQLTEEELRAGIETAHQAGKKTSAHHLCA